MYRSSSTDAYNELNDTLKSYDQPRDFSRYQHSSSSSGMSHPPSTSSSSPTSPPRQPMSSSTNHGSASDAHGLNTSAALGDSFMSHSSMSAASGASSSKAVLAALRALQDKIRRLEVERSQALDDCAKLRSQIKHLEIENEHQRQREALASQQALQEARLLCDRLTAEKHDTELKLTKVEEACKQLQREHDQLRHRLFEVESNRDQLRGQVQVLEQNSSKLESAIKASQQRENELATTILTEAKHHEEEMRELRMRIDECKVSIDASDNVDITDDALWSSTWVRSTHSTPHTGTTSRAECTEA